MSRKFEPLQDIISPYARGKINTDFEYLFEGRKKVDALNSRADEILTEAKKTNNMNENVQSQINTLIAESGTSDAEVLQARIGNDGTEYTVLKERLDYSQEEIYNIFDQISYNVKQHGAIGDGIKNDTNAIQSAINIVHEAGGGIVLLPPGIYLFDKLIIKSNVTIQGSGRSVTTLLTKNKNDKSAITRLDDVVPVFYTGFRDITITTAISGVAASQDLHRNLIGLNLTGCGYTLIDNVTVSGFGGGAIVLARAEGGNEGFEFYNTNQDGNYNTFINVNMNSCGKYNEDKAAFWLKYKANSNKFFGLYFKGGIENGTVINHGGDNLFSGVSYESMKKGIIFKNMAKNNTYIQPRFEGVTEVCFVAESGSLGNMILGFHRSTSQTLEIIESEAYLRVLGGDLNYLKSGKMESTNLTLNSDYHFLQTIGLISEKDDPLMIKSKGYSIPNEFPILKFLDTKLSVGNGDKLGEIQFSNNDNSTNASGVNAKIIAKSTTTSAKTAISFETGGENNPVEVLELGDTVKVASSDWNGKHLQMGEYHFWVDSTGKLRSKKGKPGNDLEGNIVGG